MTQASPGQLESDAALVERCLARSPGAWEMLVHRYAALVYSVARRAGLEPSEAEDVGQAVFASLLGALEGLRDKQTLAKWLITVANRQAWKAIRARRAAPTPGGDGIGLAPAQTEEPDLGAWERRQAVREGLSQLGGRCQDLLTALFSQRGTPDYQEIARRLGIPIGSIGPTRNRCLRKLMDILAAAPSGSLWSDREEQILRQEDPPGVSRGRGFGTSPPSG